MTPPTTESSDLEVRKNLPRTLAPVPRAIKMREKPRMKKDCFLTLPPLSPYLRRSPHSRPHTLSKTARGATRKVIKTRESLR